MKKALSLSTVLIVLTAALALALPAQTASAVGTWDITIDSPQGKRTSMLIIKQEGDKMTGMMKSPRGERPLDSVTVKGNEITMIMTANIQGQEMQFTYKGTIEKDSMKGTADFGGFAEGTWSAVPHKEDATTGAAATPSAPAAAAAINITGVWKFDVTLSDGGKGDPTFTFKQEGETLTGTYKGPLGEAPVTGTVKGNEAKFSYKVNYQGNDLVGTYTAKIEGKDSMSGSVSIGGVAEGKWTAKKQ